jgi:hypothetical protein
VLVIAQGVVYRGPAISDDGPPPRQKYPDQDDPRLLLKEHVQRKRQQSGVKRRAEQSMMVGWKPRHDGIMVAGRKRKEQQERPADPTDDVQTAATADSTSRHGPEKSKEDETTDEAPVVPVPVQKRVKGFLQTLSKSARWDYTEGAATSSQTAAATQQRKVRASPQSMVQTTRRTQDLSYRSRVLLYKACHQTEKGTS